MSAKAVTVPGMLDVFTYTPGDGCRYRWTKTGAIVVERITTVAGVLVMVPTGDLIPAPVTRTATAFMDAVDAWRSAP